LKKEPPKKGALKLNTQATTAKARGRQEPAYALISLIMFQASAGRREENHFDARGKLCKQEWPNLPTGHAGAKANANR